MNYQLPKAAMRMPHGEYEFQIRDDRFTPFFSDKQLLEAYQAGQRDMREAAAGVCTGIALTPSNVILGVAVECADAIRALPLEELK